MPSRFFRYQMVLSDVPDGVAPVAAVVTLRTTDKAQNSIRSRVVSIVDRQQAASSSGNESENRAGSEE